MVFDAETGAPALIYRGHRSIVMATAIGPDGRFAVTAGGQNNEIHVWDFNTGALLRSMQGSGAAMLSVGFSPDGTEVGFGQAHDFYSIHQRGPLEHILRVAGENVRVHAPLNQPERANAFMRSRIEYDGLSLYRRVAGKYGYAANLEIQRKGGAPIAVIKRDDATGFLHNAYSFTPDGKTVISGSGNGYLSAHDLKGKLIGPEYKGHFGDVWAVAISPDGRLLATGGDDQTLRLWNLATRELIVSLFYGRDGEWVAWTPQGYYTSSPGGDALVGWHINRGPDKAADFVTARQLRRHFYRPDILDEAIRRASAEEAIRIAGASAFNIADLNRRLPPELRVVSPRWAEPQTTGQAVVTVAVADDAPDLVESYTVSVGERRVPVRLVEPYSGPPADPLGRTFAASRRVAFQVPLADGDNLVRIEARNAVGESQPAELLLRQRGEGALDTRGTLYIVAIGVDKYVAASDWLDDLDFAGADARGFEAEMRARLGPLHQAVESRLLVSGAGGGLEPTRSNIADALDVLRKATANDTVAVFVAGHGVNEGHDYLFMPADAALGPDRK
jgi:hypothetical protein